MHGSQRTWPFLHWNIFVGGAISSRQTAQSKSLSKTEERSGVEPRPRWEEVDAEGWRPDAEK